MHRITRLCFVAAMLAAMVAAVPAPVGAQTSNPTGTSLKWIALGDSYSAGVGSNANPARNLCQRQQDAYPIKAMETLENEGWQFWSDRIPGAFVPEWHHACIGAVTDDYYNEQDTLGIPNPQAQRAHLTEDTQIVTLTMGGNDLGFADLVIDCLWFTCNSFNPDSEPPREGFSTMSALKINLAGLYKDIASKIDPNGDIFVLGYPELFADPTLWRTQAFDSCEGFTSSDARKANSALSRLDDTILDAVTVANRSLLGEGKQGNIHFIDIRDSFSGRGLCADGVESYIRGFSPTGSGTAPPVVATDSFHPSSLGYSAMGNELANCMRSAILSNRRCDEPVPTRPVTAATGQVSTVLILDSTGSMTTNDPARAAGTGPNRGLRLQAAESYVRNALPGDEIGVIEFDTDAQTLRPLSNVAQYGSLTRTDLASAIRTIDSSGDTNLEVGLQAGCNALEAGSRQYRAAIFLTDGDGTYTGSATRCFADAGWKVFTIGLGTGVKQTVLESIATQTGGSYRFLDPRGTRFDVCTFLQIRGEITNSPTNSCDSTATIAQGQSIDYVRPVGQGLAQISFVTNWPGSDVQATVTSPSGRVIDRSSAADDLVVDVGPTYEVLTINGPEAGDWKVRLLGADIPDGPEPFSFTTVEIPSAEPTTPPVDSDPDPATTPGDSVVVRAKGDTGDERFEVRAGGQTIASLDATTDWADYTVDIPAGTTIADIQVAFVNDAVRGTYDRNLRIQQVTYQGTTYRTEDPATLSTGTYNNRSQCKPGHPQSIALHCNGYFQFA